MSDFDNFFNDQLKCPIFREEWEKLQPEIAAVQAAINKHIAEENV